MCTLNVGCRKEDDRPIKWLDTGTSTRRSIYQGRKLEVIDKTRIIAKCLGRTLELFPKPRRKYSVGPTSDLELLNYVMGRWICK